MNITEAWQKITDSSTEVGRIGAIPVYDGEGWHIYRNSATIWPGVENAADPAKVEKLRRSTVLLLERFPDTVPQLEKLGIRIKAVLNKPIRTTADVTQWAESIFNTGPLTASQVHIEDALNLAWDDLVIEVRGGRRPQYVIPEAPKGSSNVATLDYGVPGSKVRYGPRHTFSKAAFAPQIPEVVKDPLGRSGATNGSVRPRGRPRKDGLMPGSKEAKAADKKRQEAVEKERAKRVKEREKAKLKPPTPQPRTRKPKEQPLATITELPVPEAPRRFVRVGKSAVST